MNRVYLDINAVCERYSISTRTVWRRVKKGLLPEPIYFDGPQSGGRWKLADLERLDAEREREFEAVQAGDADAAISKLVDMHVHQSR